MDEEDIVQDVVASLIQQAQRGRIRFEGDNMRPLMGMVIERTTIDCCRAVERQLDRKQMRDLLHCRSSLSRAATEFDLVALAAAMRNLHGDRKRQVIRYRLEGLTFTEMAKRLGVDDRTVRRAYASATEELREQLRRQDGGDLMHELEGEDD